MLVNQVLRSTGKREPVELLIVDINDDEGLVAVTDIWLRFHLPCCLELRAITHHDHQRNPSKPFDLCLIA